MVIDQDITEKYAIYNADTVEVAKSLKSDSVGFSVFSPPFASLYTYSNSDRDMGNVKSDDEFWQHYRYLISEQFRVMQPGRNTAIHCMNLPTSKQNDGFIGIKDFRGDLIRAYQEAGFIYHSEVCIWKDPVVAMQRTKALGLLHARGGHLVHVDIMAMAEMPKLSPHRDAIIARLSDILGLPAPSIGLKATTMEGMGFIGRKEGLAVQAIATVKLATS